MVLELFFSSILNVMNTPLFKVGHSLAKAKNFEAIYSSRCVQSWADKLSLNSLPVFRTIFEDGKMYREAQAYQGPN